MITHSDKITGLMAAMLKVQGAVTAVTKDATNPHFKNRYASLEAVVDAIRPACQKNGLVVMQAPGEFSDGAVTVETSGRAAVSVDTPGFVAFVDAQTAHTLRGPAGGAGAQLIEVEIRGADAARRKPRGLEPRLR